MRAHIYIICLLLVSFFDVFSQSYPDLYRKANHKEMKQWVDSVYSSLSEDEKIGQLFMVIADLSTSAQNQRLLLRYVEEMNIGGVLFHKGSTSSQAKLTNMMQKSSRIPLMVSLDGEWGLSMRLSGTTRFPKNMMLGAIEDMNLLEAYGEEVGRQCREMGIHINFAPDLDVNSNVDNPVIGLRSFAETPEQVADKGIAYAKGLEKTGIISVAKHFPGHGDTSDDSHKTLPAVRHSRERLDSIELYPFKKYVYEGFAGMMTGHLFVPSLDNSKKPASLSAKVITDLLKNEIGFKGLCFTDALAMKGASSNNKDNPCVQALLAGNDVLLAPANPFSDFKAVKEAVSSGLISSEMLEEKCRKILEYKYIAGLNNYKPIEIKNLSARLNSPHAEWLASRLNAEAITLLKNEDEIIPLKNLDKKKIAVLTIGESVDCEFHTTIDSYAKVKHFSILRSTPAATVQRIYNELNDYDVIICGVHTVRIPENAALRKLVAEKELIYTFFTIPYFSKNYKSSITKAKSFVMAYEATPLAQKYAAQLLFGGIAAKGKLSVSIPGLYYSGSGLFTEKTRLGFHEPEEVGVNPKRLSLIDSVVNEGLKAKAYPGCQVLVAKDGMVIYNKSFGRYDYKNHRSVNNFSVYDLASASKAAGTLLAVMKAYDENKFNLNNKISQFVSELDSSNKKNITVKQLLYHQSGLPSTINFYLSAIDKDSYKGSLYSNRKTQTHSVKFDSKTYVRNDFTFLPQLVSSVPKKGYDLKVADDFYLNSTFQDTIIMKIKDSRLTKPGSYRYGCVNFILLKIMVERLFSQPMDKLLDENFYSRLGAYHTTYNPLEKMGKSDVVPTEYDGFIRRQLIQGYVHDEAAAFQGGVSGNAGLFSNAEDLAKVLQLYLNLGEYGGERYLSSETCKLFTMSKSPTCRRGLGFDKPSASAGSSPCGALTPLSVYGHTGFSGTCFWVDPTNNMIYIFLSNRINPTRANSKLSSLDIRTRIQDIIYKSMDRKTGKEM